ncbi:MAG: hypothetical protein WBF75_08850 [Pseudonocardiaceae bacterium]
MAFADESFQEDPSGGCYVLATAVLEQKSLQPTRELMRRLLGSRRTNKLHWHEMDRLQQKDAAYSVAGIKGFHVVAVGTPVPRRRQERARSACLAALVSELHGRGVEHLLVEARAATLNRRDVTTVQGARFALPQGSNFRVDHLPGPAKPLLWIADIVAGAVRSSRQGGPASLELLGEASSPSPTSTACSRPLTPWTQLLRPSRTSPAIPERCRRDNVRLRLRELSGDKLDKVAEILGCPVALLATDQYVHGIEVTCLHNRNRHSKLTLIPTGRSNCRAAGGSFTLWLSQIPA